MPRRLTTEEFIVKAKLKYNDKYDYSKTEYINSNTKVCIICPEHGEFWQVPNSHIHSGGCPKCGVARRTKERTLSLETFIKRSNIVHEFKYDYSDVEYKTVMIKVKIKCEEHGIFEQTPISHLQGVGCPKCAWKQNADNKRYTTLTFIKKAKDVHGNKFDYSKVNYKTAFDKVTIICPIHGEFEQKPYLHLYGSRCPLCKADYSNPRYIHYLYKITNTINNNIYIGVHSTFKEDDGYMGSGKLLKEDQIKYGMSTFKKEIMRYYKTREELLNAEREVVTSEFISRSDTYNLIVGG
jgi:hypothetical protein